MGRREAYSIVFEARKDSNKFIPRSWIVEISHSVQFPSPNHHGKKQEVVAISSPTWYPFIYWEKKISHATTLLPMRVSYNTSNCGIINNLQSESTEIWERHQKSSKKSQQNSEKKNLHAHNHQCWRRRHGGGWPEPAPKSKIHHSTLWAHSHPTLASKTGDVRPGWQLPYLHGQFGRR